MGGIEERSLRLGGIVDRFSEEKDGTEGVLRAKDKGSSEGRVWMRVSDKNGRMHDQTIYVDNWNLFHSKAV